ncbi:hypothetical protein ACOMHN_016528 [Nucella lapillus]
MCINLALKITEYSSTSKDHADNFVITCKIERSCPPLYSMTNALLITLFFPTWNVGKGMIIVNVIIIIIVVIIIVVIIIVVIIIVIIIIIVIVIIIVIIIIIIIIIIVVVIISVTLGWDGSARYPPLMKSCVMLSPPHHQVIFISFLSVNIAPGDVLIAFPGPLSVWPDLAGHFPCDLVPQCAQSEDEAPCPYTSDKCGVDKIEAGSRCYLFKTIVYRRWTDSDTECRKQGALLSSLETSEEWSHVLRLLEYANKPRLIWIGLTATGSAKRTSYLRAM